MVTMLKNKCSVWKRIKFPTFWYNCCYFTWSDTYFIQLETLLINHSSYLLHESSSSSWEANRSQPVKNFPTFYGTRRFITRFTSARHLSLSWASSIQSIGHTNVSIQVQGNCSCLVKKRVFTVRSCQHLAQTPKLEDHPLSAVHGCLFSIFAATLHTGGRSSILNLRTRHAVVTGTHLSWTVYIY